MTPPRIIDSVEVEVLELPTEHGPESDGTLVWDSTTMILVELRCAGVAGLGYTYAHAATARLIEGVLAPIVRGAEAMDVPVLAARMTAAVRNQGLAGIAAMAISAVDAALWDLEARLLELPLATLLGAARPAVLAYASGGFTSTGLDALAEEVAGYVEAGYRAVKIKVGRDPAHDVERVRAAREAAGAGVALMVDANGAYTRPQALALAERFAEHDVTWFEEPIAPADHTGLRLLRERAPAARGLGLSSHCAPTLHAHVAAAAPQIVHLECFRDHVRFEQLVFDGAAAMTDGAIAYDRQRPGLGIAVRRREANRHAV